VEAEFVDVKGEYPRDLPPHYPDAHLAIDLPDHGVVFFTHADPGNPPIYRSSGGAQDRPVAPTYSDLGSDEAIFGLLFEAMGGPAGDPADGEGGGKEVSGEAEAVREQGRVELDVDLEVAAGPVLLEQPQRGLLHFQGQVVEVFSPPVVKRSFAAAARTSARGSRTR
jgi:hypothetical protein